MRFGRVCNLKLRYQKLTVRITLNKNAVHGDTSALAPGGIRVGTPALTSRGFTESDFVQVGEFLHEALQICISVQEQTGKPIKDFMKGLEGNAAIKDLRIRVKEFARKFNMPGFDPIDIEERIKDEYDQE